MKKYQPIGKKLYNIFSMFIQSASCSLWNRWNSRDINDSKIYASRNPTRSSECFGNGASRRVASQPSFISLEFQSASNENNTMAFYFVASVRWSRDAFHSNKAPFSPLQILIFLHFRRISAVTSRAFRLLHAPHRWFKRKFPNALRGPANILTRSVL